jgi:hypothetical protein
MEDDSEAVLAEISEKSDAELRDILDRLDSEEQRLSYERRMMHAKIDILRAELTARLKEKHRAGKSMISGRDLERLTEILARDLTKDKKKSS